MHKGPVVYEIEIEEYLDRQWSDWFGGWQIDYGEDGSTRLTGAVADQAALHGILAMIRDLGLTLVALRRDTNRYDKSPRFVNSGLER